MIPTSNHRSPTARISAATTLTGLPATTKVAEFSSRGPNSVSPAILKVIDKACVSSLCLLQILKLNY